MKTVGFLLLLLAIGGGLTYYAQHSSAGPAIHYRTAAVEKGELLSTIGATGTVEPEEVVDVGARVMGLILEFGADPRDPAKSVDFGTVVEKGTVLARIDPVPFEAALEQAEASLEQSKANLLELEAKGRQAERDLRRAESLVPKKAIADSDYELILSNFEAANAAVAVGKANIRQNEAAVKTAKINLGYTTITSPVRGVIIARRVNIGQMVVASLNAPSLFLIAKDLRQVQVWASVNEADIGRIRLQMPVQFTVDALPGEVFPGKVTQIRLNAAMTQNVVTYTVVVTTDNSKSRLLPYLTANVQFELDRRTDVLLVPNAALRWKPAGAAEPEPAGEKAANEPGRGRLWAPTEDGSVQPIDVSVGATDGSKTEVSGGDLKEGMQVVIGSQGADEGSGAEESRNPFLPKMPRGTRPPPGPM